MNKHKDLIVIGLGPAGASLLYSASEKGLNVMGVDRRREVGIPIQCGEYIPSYSELPNLLPETPIKYLDIFRNLPNKLILNYTSRVRLYTPSNDTYEVGFKGIVIDRALFDKWLVTKAIESGAEVHISTNVYKVDEEGKVYLSNGEIFSADVVAIAAGASSPLLDQAGLYRETDKYNLAYLIQYVMAGVDAEEDVVEMYTGSRYAPGAYAWIIPRGFKMANVGVGIRKPYISDPSLTLRDFLDRFIKEHPVASLKLSRAYPLSIVGGVVPVGPPSKKTVSRRFISLGDAANQVISSLGAGIVTAVIAGEIAGEVISKYVSGVSELDEYETLWRKYIGRVLEDGYKLRLAIDVLTRSDKMIDYGMKVIGKRYISNLVYTKAPKGVDLVKLLIEMSRDLLS